MNFDKLSAHPAFKYVVICTLIAVGAVILSTLLRKSLSLFLKKSSGDLKVDPTKYSFLKNAVSFVVYSGAIMAIFYTVPVLRSLGTTLFASAGILAAILGFASQQAFSNIISGIFIVIFKPFRVGDIIEVGTFVGFVEDITLRHTVIQDFENRRVIIPNSNISAENIKNSSIKDQRINKRIFFGISYDSDVEKAIEIIREEATNHPNCIEWRTKEEIKNETPLVYVRVISFGDSSVNLRANVWAKGPIEAFEMECDLNRSIKKRFDAEGIEIPFPHRTLVFKNPIPQNEKGQPENKT